MENDGERSVASRPPVNSSPARPSTGSSGVSTTFARPASFPRSRDQSGQDGVNQGSQPSGPRPRTCQPFSRRLSRDARESKGASRMLRAMVRCALSRSLSARDRVSPRRRGARPLRVLRAATTKPPRHRLRGFSQATGRSRLHSATFSSSARTRTSDQAVNSRPLYRLSYAGITAGRRLAGDPESSRVAPMRSADEPGASAEKRSRMPFPHPRQRAPPRPRRAALSSPRPSFHASP
jgi:hypothetical protein